MSKRPATITKGQAALLIVCVALAALLLAGSACVWLVHSRRQAAGPAGSQTAQTDLTRPAGTMANATWIGEVDVSGMTEEEALAALADYVAQRPDEVLTVTLPDRTLRFEGVRSATLSDAVTRVRQALEGEGGAYPLTLDYTIHAAVIRETIRAAGYTPGVYYNLDYARNYVDRARLGGYVQWFAQYASAPSRSDWAIWQYSSSHTIPGISGKFDANLLGD